MTWQIDSAHSHIYFTARHMMISKVRGQFESFTGSVNYDEQNPTRTTVDIEIDIKSINTKEEKRDTHLLSADFFDADNYPTMRFQSTKVEQVDEDSGKLYGNLTIHGVTKPVVLEVEYAGQAKSPWGTVSAGFSGTTTINRKDWGLNWNQTLETGGVLVGDKIQIEIELELVQVTEAEAVPA